MSTSTTSTTSTDGSLANTVPIELVNAAKDATNGNYYVSIKRGSESSTITCMKLDLAHPTNKAIVDDVEYAEAVTVIAANVDRRNKGEKVDAEAELGMIARQVRGYCAKYLQLNLDCIFEKSTTADKKTEIKAVYVDVNSRADTTEILAFLNMLFVKDDDIKAKIKSEKDGNTAYDWSVPRFKKFIMDSRDPAFAPGFDGVDTSDVGKKFKVSTKSQKLPMKAKHGKDRKKLSRNQVLIIIVVVMFLLYLMNQQ